MTDFVRENLHLWIIATFFISSFKALPYNNTWRGHLGENGQNYQIYVFCSKSIFRYGDITSQIFRGLAALEPPKMGDKGERFVFFVFNRKRKRKWKKYFVHFVGNLSMIPKLFFFPSSIKTEEVLFFYIYTYLYIFVYI